jgi:hypothetical protein
MAVLNEIPRPQRVERQPVDLKLGGVIAVVLGEGGDLPTEYGFHPRVRPIDGRIIDPRDPQQQLPANAQAVIFGGGKKLDRKIFEGVHEYLKRKRILYRICNNDEHLLQALKEMVPEEKKAAEVAAPKTEDEKTDVAKRQQAGHGAIKRLVEEHVPQLLKKDPTMPISEMGRQLFRIAQDKGISTTLGSCEQCARVYKRSHGVGERPPSVQSEEQKGLTGIYEIIGHMEAAVASMKRMRQAFIDREAEHAKLSKQIATMKEVFGVFKNEIEG